MDVAKAGRANFVAARKAQLARWAPELFANELTVDDFPYGPVVVFFTDFLARLRSCHEGAASASGAYLNPNLVVLVLEQAGLLAWRTKFCLGRQTIALCSL